MPRPTAGIDWLLWSLNESGSGVIWPVIIPGCLFESSWGWGWGGKGGKKGLREKSLLICAYDGDKRGGVYVLYSIHGTACIPSF